MLLSMIPCFPTPCCSGIPTSFYIIMFTRCLCHFSVPRCCLKQTSNRSHSVQPNSNRSCRLRNWWPLLRIYKLWIYMVSQMKPLFLSEIPYETLNLWKAVGSCTTQCRLLLFHVKTVVIDLRNFELDCLKKEEEKWFWPFGDPDNPLGVLQ